jgi:hypothetical protein
VSVDLLPHRRYVSARTEASNDREVAVRKLYAVAAALPLSLMFVSPAWSAPRSAQHVTITIDATAAPGTPSPATATGPISGTGTDVQTSDRTAGRTDHATDVLTFPNGTVTIKNSGVDSSTIDASTCTGHIAARGIWTITGGTGDYAHAKGHGHFTVSGSIQGTPGPDGCGPPTGSIVIEAVGKVSL